MGRRRSWARLLACSVGVLAAASAAAADLQQNPLGLGPSDSPAVTAFPGHPVMLVQEVSDTVERPLMTLLDDAGIGRPFHDAGINAYGWLEGSYTRNFSNPQHFPGTYIRQNEGRLFDFESNNGLVNQLDLTFERLVQVRSNAFDIGGRVDILYGGDARFIHSYGLLDRPSGALGGPQYQLDIPQAYADIAVPVGEGLRVRVGKFEFLKPIDPNLSAFYSHSFVYAAGGRLFRNPSQFDLNNLYFGTALPFSLTGASALYTYKKNLHVEAGLSDGWDQSVSDNNHAIDGFGRVKYDRPGRGGEDDPDYVAVAVITGPEIANDNHFRTAIDATLKYAITDRLAFILDSVYGVQARPGFIPSPATTDNPNPFPGAHIGGGDAHWGDIAAYLIYQVDSHLDLAGRVEYYRDEQGYTTGVAQNLYEATLGATITPFPDDQFLSGFKVRPEVRWDHSDKSFFNYLTKHDQVTVAVDAIYNF